MFGVTLSVREVLEKNLMDSASEIDYLLNLNQESKKEMII